MTDFFTEGPIDPRIYKELATDMWRDAVSYLPVMDVLKLPGLCKYFNEEIVWHKWSGRLLWGEMPHIDERVFKTWPSEDPPTQTALIRACKRGAPVAHVVTLVTGRANVNAVDSNSDTALHWSASEHRGHEDIVRVLLGANADPNIGENEGGTCLHIASCYGHTVVVSALIEAGSGVNINQSDIYGKTALMYAAVAKDSSVDGLKILVNSHADINLIDNEGKTALDIARDYNRHNSVCILEKAQKYIVCCRCYKYKTRSCWGNNTPIK